MEFLTFKIITKDANPHALINKIKSNAATSGLPFLAHYEGESRNSK